MDKGIDYKILVEILKYYREIHEVSMRDLYKISGISENRILKLESSQAKISLKTLDRYAKAIRMNISDFILEYEKRLFWSKRNED